MGGRDHPRSPSSVTTDESLQGGSKSGEVSPERSGGKSGDASPDTGIYLELKVEELIRSLSVAAIPHGCSEDDMVADSCGDDTSGIDSVTVTDRSDTCRNNDTVSDSSRNCTVMDIPRVNDTRIIDDTTSNNDVDTFKQLFESKSYITPDRFKVSTEKNLQNVSKQSGFNDVVSGDRVKESNDVTGRDVDWTSDVVGPEVLCSIPDEDQPPEEDFTMVKQRRRKGRENAHRDTDVVERRGLEMVNGLDMVKGSDVVDRRGSDPVRQTQRRAGSFQVQPRRHGYVRHYAVGPRFLSSREEDNKLSTIHSAIESGIRPERNSELSCIDISTSVSRMEMLRSQSVGHQIRINQSQVNQAQVIRTQMNQSKSSQSEMNQSKQNISNVSQLQLIPAPLNAASIGSSLNSRQGQASGSRPMEVSVGIQCDLDLDEAFDNVSQGNVNSCESMLDTDIISTENNRISRTDDTKVNAESCSNISTLDTDSSLCERLIGNSEDIRIETTAVILGLDNNCLLARADANGSTSKNSSASSCDDGSCAGRILSLSTSRFNSADSSYFHLHTAQHFLYSS